MNTLFRVTVYDDSNKVVDSWTLDSPDDRCADKEASADVDREYPGCDWSLVAVNDDEGAA